MKKIPVSLINAVQVFPVYPLKNHIEFSQVNDKDSLPFNLTAHNKLRYFLKQCIVKLLLKPNYR